MKAHIVMVAGLLAACSPSGPDDPAGPEAAPEAAVAADEGVPEAETLPGVSLDNVTAGDSFSSPMTVTGVAPNDWYFEAIFPVELVDSSGEVLAEAPAEAQSDWMQEGPIAFRADLVFEVDEPVEAELVLQEDMPGDGEEPRELRVPVLLTPAAE